MRIGFTGPRTGMTPQQGVRLQQLLITHRRHSRGQPEFHHGDCRGADETAATIARDVGYYIVGHPPDDGSMRARFNSDEEWPVKPYLERNGEIVAVIDLLIACPTSPERMRSGTWYTIRFARNTDKPLTIINRDGDLRP